MESHESIHPLVCHIRSFYHPVPRWNILLIQDILLLLGAMTTERKTKRSAHPVKKDISTDIFKSSSLLCFWNQVSENRWYFSNKVIPERVLRCPALTLFLSVTRFPKHSDRLRSLTLKKNCVTEFRRYMSSSRRRSTVLSLKVSFEKLLQGFWAAHLSGYAGFSAWASKSGGKEPERKRQGEAGH